jgi:transketolase
VPTIKPLDEKTILGSTKKTGRVVTVEEAQIAGGFGSAISELLSEKQPMQVLRIGMKDEFGESGSAEELYDKFGLSVKSIVNSIHSFVLKKRN